MRRGELWWANLPRPIGQRPVVLLSRDTAYDTRELVIVSPVTTRVRGLYTEVPLGPEDGLRRASVANLDVIMTVSKGRLRERISGLSPEKLAAVDAAIHFAMGMEE
jgi:mRNA interferase MazF